MTKYSANNGDSLVGLTMVNVFFIIIPIMAIVTYQQLWTIVLILVPIITFYLSIKYYKKIYFEIDFLENEISIRYPHRELKLKVPYSDLISIDYRKGKRSMNIFKIRQDNNVLKLSTSAIASGEEYVHFIKYLKSKNTDFKTYIYPKGSHLHMRLRQELLGTEY
jgi:hypothetical protein